MKSSFIRGLALGLTAVGLLSGAHAQYPNYGSNMLPMPQQSMRYPISQTSFYNRQGNVEQVDPGSPTVAPGAVPGAAMPAHGAGVMPSTPYVENAAPHVQGAAPHGAYPESYSGGAGCQDCNTGHAPAAYPAYGHGDSYCGGDAYGGSVYGHGGGCGIGAGSMFGGGWRGGRLLHGAAFVSAGQPRCGWYATANALIMNRDKEDHYTFSFGSGFESLQLLNTRDANMDFAGGVETRIGKYFNCGRNAIELGYWGIYPDSQENILTAGQVVGNLDAILNFDQLTIGALTLDNWVNNADAHRLRRDFEFHNFELSILNYSGCAGYGCCGQQRFHWNWGYGFRYFMFGEDLLFSARENGAGTSFTGGADQVDYNVDVDNHLFGFQGTCMATYNVTCKLALTMGSRFGLYANYIEHSSYIGSNGTAAYINNGPNLGRVWDKESNKEDVAFIGEINLGLSYDITCCWSINAGYRAMAVTGVALASEQIPHDLRGIDDALFIDSNASLILHGAYIGASYNF